MRIIVITGMSGSGKSTAVRALEDEGYYCIDNLPVRLFKRFVDLIEKSGESFKGIVLVADIRGREFFKGYESAFQKIRQRATASRSFFSMPWMKHWCGDFRRPAVGIRPTNIAR